jgi:hypothetical protein
MKYLAAFGFCICIAACNSSRHHYLKLPLPAAARTGGSVFYKSVAASKWQQRDSIAVKEILSGNMPSFLKKFVAVTSAITDSAGIKHTAVLYVAPDYLSVGTNEDWARVPLTPMAAQKIADSFNCFLPTKKIVDLLYDNALIQLEPIPMYAYRDSSVTMWQHHLIIEGQRKSKKGLIAGIKKDVVISGKISTDTRPNRVAIYGWHQLNGKPIQPLYTGHINWWVDYSHGIRLIWRTIKVDGKEMDYTAVLQHPIFKKLICDEAGCDFFKYAY